jgi:TetR/AcrR family tetracycline transcriptional repressor
MNPTIMPAKKNTRKNPRKPGERAGLSHEEILRHARSLAERGGLEAITMRAVANELGVLPNALYTYFQEKLVLLDALLDSLVGEIVPPPVTRDWQDGLVELMLSTRKLLLSHPYAISLFLSRPGGPNGLRLGEVIFQVLNRGGVRGKQAVDAFRVLMVYTFGFAAQEIPRDDPARKPSQVNRGKSLFALFEPNELAITRRLLPYLSRHPGQEDFERGLSWIIRGIVESAKQR